MSSNLIDRNQQTEQPKKIINPNVFMAVTLDDISRNLKILNDTSKHLTDLTKIINENIKNSIPAGILYNSTSTISVATDVTPESYETLAVVGPPDTPGYDRHEINQIMGRNAPKITVTNDGDYTLYVIISTNAESWSTEESLIYTGETKIFTDVYELRIRCPTAGTPYRVTEYDSELAYSIIRGVDTDTNIPHTIKTDDEGRIDVISDDVINPSTTPVIYNVVMTNLNTEYFQILPADTKKIEFRCQNLGFEIRYAYETGRVATSIVPYGILGPGECKTVSGLLLTDKILYFACSTAARVMQIECWS